MNKSITQATQNDKQISKSIKRFFTRCYCSLVPRSSNGFCRCFAFQIGKICYHHCIIRHFQFRKCLPVNSNFFSMVFTRNTVPVSDKVWRRFHFRLTVCRVFPSLQCFRYLTQRCGHRIYSCSCGGKYRLQFYFLPSH